jgi:hypothetical protein
MGGTSKAFEFKCFVSLLKTREESFGGELLILISNPQDPSLFESMQR